MPIITRILARQFRAILRRCVLRGQPRGHAPPVLIQQAGENLTLFACAGEVALRWRGPAPDRSDGCFTVPLQLLNDVEGSAGTPVVLKAEADSHGRASWNDRGLTQEICFESLPDTNAPVVPAEPGELSAQPREFLIALHEVGRTAARDAVRYRLDRIQVRGAAGKLIASDARSALVRGGSHFPFADDLLVPAVPAFGSRELADMAPVAVGRTNAHLVVTAGPWTFFLVIDCQGRFPQVEDLIPRRPLPTRLILAESDSRALAEALRSAGTEEESTVTVELGPFVTATCRTGEAAVTEIALAASSLIGPPVTLALAPRLLARMLALGLTTLECSSAGKPVVARAGDMTFLAMSSPPAQAATKPERNGDHPVPAQPPHDSQRSNDMSTGDRNGRTEPPPNEAIDPVADADGLRTALQQALTHANRLTTALRLFRRQRRTVQTALESLKSLPTL